MKLSAFFTSRQRGFFLIAWAGEALKKAMPATVEKAARAPDWIEDQFVGGSIKSATIQKAS